MPKSYKNGSFVELEPPSYPSLLISRGRIKEESLTQTKFSLPVSSINVEPTHNISINNERQQEKNDNLP